MAGATRKNLTIVEGGASLPADLDGDLVNAIKRYVESTLFPLRERLVAQEEKLAALEARPEPPPGRDGLPGVPGPAGRDGRDGAPGQDGFGFDDLRLLRTGEREVTFEFTSGERVKRFPVVVPAVIYRGVYKPEKAYELGDVVSFGGSGWHCNQPTDTKPDDGNPAWTLAIKHGRDGRDGTSAYDVAVAGGFKGSEADWLKSLKGPPGPPGRDLRHLMG